MKRRKKKRKCWCLRKYLKKVFNPFRPQPPFFSSSFLPPTNHNFDLRVTFLWIMFPLNASTFSTSFRPLLCVPLPLASLLPSYSYFSSKKLFKSFPLFFFWFFFPFFLPPTFFYSKILFFVIGAIFLNLIIDLIDELPFAAIFVPLT